MRSSFLALVVILVATFASAATPSSSPYTIDEAHLYDAQTTPRPSQQVGSNQEETVLEKRARGGSSFTTTPFRLRYVDYGCYTMDMHNGCYRPKGNFYIAPGVPRADVGCLRPCGTWDNLVNWSQVMLDAGPVLVPVTFVCVCAVAAAAEAGYNVCRNGVLAARMRIQTTAEYLATSSQELATAIADRAQEFFEAGQGALLQIGDGREQSSDSEDASDYRTALGEPNLDEEDNEDQDDGNAATSSRQGMNNNDYDDDDDTRRPILISSDEEAADDEDRHNPRRNGKGPMYPQTSRPRPRLSGQAYYEAVQRYLRQPVATNEASPFSHNARQPSQRDHLTQRRRARTPLNFDLNEPASPPSHG